ncbi:TrkA family potassium uptake protein [Bacillus salipaludis]|uniref:TrkA family potassium uptake protein n=1 Tax=Bacillus salipaludis TaxID=2547811 RepID=A0A4R5VVV1_9BACI|nr:TrkA family potassium uptake protein [Bacillus salipaludis]MDQ6597293.1 TrkA family potassium uptake protein [Bacillus salipaludis]TDK63266.1 TrkA family potassium uptake protein [Bacillus salipaludis]
MTKQFAVIGMGRFGSSLSAELFKDGAEVLVIDKNEKRIQENSDFSTHAVVADTTDERVIKELGLRNMDVVVVAIGDDIQASILTVMILKELGAKQVIAKAVTNQHAKVLTQVGADRVVLPERETGIRIAKNLLSPNVLDFIELSDEYKIEEIVASSFMIGKSLRELDIRAKYQLSVIAIKSNGKMNISPFPDDTINPGDTLVVLGEKKLLKKFETKTEKALFII